MKIRFPKIRIRDIAVFFTMWLLGIGMFYMLIIFGQEKIGYQVAWRPALIFSAMAGFVWTIIGMVLVAKDDKITRSKEAISAAVSKLFEKP